MTILRRHAVTTQTSSSTITTALTDAAMARHFGLFGLALIAAAFVYLIGANWLLLPSMVKLGIMPLLMLITALISMRVDNPSLVSTLHAICGLFTGLALAAIGQVYQTGADSAWLFIIWSCLLLLWLNRANLGVFILLLIVSQIAAWQAGTQLLGLSHGGDNTLLVLVGFGVLAILSLTFRQLAAKVKWLIAVAFSLYAIYSGGSLGDALLRGDMTALSVAAWLLMMLTPWGLFWIWRHQAVLAAAIALAGAATAIFVGMMSWLNISDLLLVALICNLWFAFLAFVLFKYYKKSTAEQSTDGDKIGIAKQAGLTQSADEQQMHLTEKAVALLLGVGGWVSSLIAFGWLLVTFDQGFWPMLSLGVILIIVGLGLLAYLGRPRQTQQASIGRIYLKHLSYAVTAIGTAAYWMAVDDQLLSWWVVAVIWLIAFILLRLRAHWFYVSLYLLTGFGLLVLKSLQHGDYWSIDASFNGWGWLLYALGLCTVLLLEIMQRPKTAISIDDLKVSVDHHRMFGFLALAISVGFSVYFSLRYSVLLGGTGVGETTSYDTLKLLACLPLLVGLGALLGRSANRTWAALLPLGALAGFGYAGILVALVVYAVSMRRDDKLIQGLALAVGVGLIWQLYYQLSVPFIWKFISIGLMGILFIGMGAALSVNRRADTDITGVVS